MIIELPLVLLFQRVGLGLLFRAALVAELVLDELLHIGLRLDGLALHDYKFISML